MTEEEEESETAELGKLSMTNMYGHHLKMWNYYGGNFAMPYVKKIR